MNKKVTKSTLKIERKPLELLNIEITKNGNLNKKERRDQVFRILILLKELGWSVYLGD